MKLRIHIENIKNNRGNILIALFKDGVGYPDNHNEAVNWVILDAEVPSVFWDVELNAEGYYAVTCFHDESDSGKLKKNIMGIPTNPIGFSNNMKPVIGAPSFLSTRFMVEGELTEIKIRLFTL